MPRFKSVLRNPALYLALAVVGTIVPYAALLPWLADNGLAAGRLFQEASETRISAFAWIDVAISALVLIIASIQMLSARRTAIVAAACLGVGVSAGLPLFLYFLAKEQHPS